MAKKKSTTKKADKNKKAEIIKDVRQSNELLTRVLRVVAVVFCTLTVYALVVSNSTLTSDWLAIKEVGFSGIFKSGFPELNNPVGPFGALLGYFTSIILGHYFAIILLLGALLKNLIALFGKKESEIGHNISLVIGLFFFLQLLLTHFFLEEPRVLNGQISFYINSFLQKFIGSKGTVAFLIIVAILDILLIFGWEPVKVIFFGVIKTIFFPFFKKKNIDVESVDFDDDDDPSIKKDRRGNKKKKSKKESKKELDFELPIIDHKNTHTEEEEPEFKIVEPKIQSHKKSNDSFKINEPEKSVILAVKKNKPEQMESDSGTIEKYIKPDVDKFLQIPDLGDSYDKEAIEANIKKTSIILQNKLAEFGIEAEVVNVNIGPIITQYELKPAPGIKVNKFSSYADDLGLALKAVSIRIQAPIPGRGLVGIEIPNKQSDIIFLKEILLSDEMKNNDNVLSIGLGKDISGKPVIADLAKMPHMIIAGATGSGKSVCINTIITSLLLRTSPDEVRLIMIDPKRVELAGYASVPHLWTDVVTDPEESLETFKWAVEEMERRYQQLQDIGVRDRASYNKKVVKINAKLAEGVEPEHTKMPFIVIIVDEFADLIMTAGKEIELPITRLAQMARAVGMHIILATQRPSIKVITGVIKANFPARIAFQVSSRVDSRVILDEMGAEKLLGRGDMLFVPPGTSTIQRIHGAYVSDEEINSIVDYLETQPKPAFRMEKIVASGDEVEAFSYDDELFPEAARLIVNSNVASVSMLQRSFKIGYARAGRLIDMLEQARIVGPHKGSKSREVTASMEDLKVYGIEEI
ncbi:MAG: hypothetical protein B6226_01675 [Candidatus Cloacimonetes bacterium 4572_65]|nr:MAG: hypothetical protein B6226_01675 [Candidatus Cloacimonetes bacterium 4572_65]